jgi:hypothetical protein
MIATAPSVDATGKRHRVVVIGSGFAGLTAAKALKNRLVERPLRTVASDQTSVARRGGWSLRHGVETYSVAQSVDCDGLDNDQSGSRAPRRNRLRRRSRLSMAADRHQSTGARRYEPRVTTSGLPQLDVADVD